nr:hypothetical protein CFP56_49387 [Quercus suber]
MRQKNPGADEQHQRANTANEPRRRRATPTSNTDETSADSPNPDESRRRFHQTPTDEPSNTDGEARRIQAPILTKPR